MDWDGKFIDEIIVVLKEAYQFYDGESLYDERDRLGMVLKRIEGERVCEICGDVYNPFIPTEYDMKKRSNNG